LLLLAAPLHADYQAGLDAYADGHYRRAMAEWKAVAAQPPGAVNPAVYAETHFAIAGLYWDGQGVERDFYEARSWLEKAAGRGHAGAMAKLGYMYTDGLTVDQDFDTAFEWYSQAARLGDVDGLYNLGIFYLNGWGTEQDTTMARQYLAAASAQGDEAAEQALQQLLAEADRSRLTPLLQEEEEPVGGASAATGEAATDGSRLTPLLQEEDDPVGGASAATGGFVGGASAATGEAATDGSRLTPLLHNEDWILAQPPAHYTIQAIGLRDRDKLMSLVAGHDELAPLAIYVVQKNTNPIHVLLQGSYPTVEAARAARDTFPAEINPPDQVWIRQFEKVQEIIRKENGL
jgi:hypothetical protein